MSGRVAVTFSMDAAMYAAIERRARPMNLRATEYIRRLTEAAYAARVGAEKKLPVSDNELDRAVRAVFCLSGEFSIAEIARATGLPADMVDNALRGFRMVGEDIASRGSFSASRAASEASPPGAPAGRATRRDARSGLRPMAECSPTAGGGKGDRPSPDFSGASAQASAEGAVQPRAPAETSPAAGARREAKQLPRAGGYSPDEIETVRRLWADGCTAEAIARAIGRSSSSVRTWIRDHRDVCPHRRGGGGGS